MSYRNNYLDLDPTYKDPLGRPLMRMTFDYQDERAQDGQLDGRPLRRDRQGDGRQDDAGQPARPARGRWCRTRPRTTPAAR